MAENFASSSVTSTLANYPDLQVTNLAVSPTAAQTSSRVTVTWNDLNSGRGDVTRAFDDHITVVNTTTGQTVTTADLPYDATQPGAAIVAGTSSAQRQYAFTVPDGSAGVGTLQVTVTTNYTKSIFEYNYGTIPGGHPVALANNSASTSLTTTLAPSPDLQVANLTMAPASASAGLQSGATVNLSWDDMNTGDGDTTNNGSRSGSFHDSVVVQKVDGFGNVLATLVTTAVPSSAIAAHRLGSQTYSFQLPDGIAGSGNLKITVTANIYNEVFESNSANNTASITATAALAPYPDLQVTSLAVTPASGVQSGDTVQLTWYDSNTGTGPTTGAFYDRVVVVNNATRQTVSTTDVYYDPAASGNGAIAAGDLRPRQLPVTLPQGTPGAGQLQFTVTTNYFHQIFEYNTAGPGGTSNADSNNSASVNTTVALAPYADLATTGVTAPALTVGDPAQVTIGWTVTNVGTGTGTTANWVGSIIASSDNDPTHGAVIKKFPHQGLLAVNGSYTQSQTFLLPPGYTTHSHLFVEADGNNNVFENGNKANNYAEAPNFFDVTPIPYADLVVNSVSSDATASSGQTMQISWTVTNQSPNAIGTTNIDSWSDSLYLASDPAGHNIVGPSLGAFDHIGALALGGSYSRTAQVTLPNGLSGTFYPVITTGGPYEFIYTYNNTTVATTPVVVSLTPAPDLTPTHLVATTPGSTAEVTTANTGDKIDVTWTVQNLGPGNANPTWTDRLYLQQLGGTGSRFYNLGFFDFPNALQAGTSYTRSEQVQLPSHIQGVFQLRLTTAGGLFENGATANNDFSDPDSLTITAPARPDLQVFSIDSAPHTANAGGTVAVTFTVINQGTVAATGQWNDNVYISLHNTLDGAAQLLGTFGNQQPPGRAKNTRRRPTTCSSPNASAARRSSSSLPMPTTPSTSSPTAATTTPSSSPSTSIPSPRPTWSPATWPPRTRPLTARPSPSAIRSTTWVWRRPTCRAGPILSG
jgi:hypothetical protein